VKAPAVKPRVKTRAEKEREDFVRRQQVANQINRERLNQLRRKKTIEPLDSQVKVQVAKSAEHPLVAAAEARAKARREAELNSGKKLTPQQLKERAIARAFAQMEKMQAEGVAATAVVTETITTTIDKKRHFWQSKRFVLATVMSAAAVMLLGYFVYLNMPDISVRVVASRAGIDVAYPNYLPAGYKLNGLVSEQSGRVSMTFVNDAHKFSVTQEKSIWDSTALYNNFVKDEWGASAVILREQGLTIYVNGSDATWVNGGIRYTIDDIADGLTKQQIRDIAVSF
jgi:hypothetical protein